MGTMIAIIFIVIVVVIIIIIIIITIIIIIIVINININIVTGIIVIIIISLRKKVAQMKLMLLAGNITYQQGFHEIVFRNAFNGCQCGKFRTTFLDSIIPVPEPREELEAAVVEEFVIPCASCCKMEENNCLETARVSVVVLCKKNKKQWIH